MELFPAVQLNREQPELGLELFTPHPAGLHADEFEGLVQLLQIVDQKVCPWTIDRLHLTDDAFLEVEPALAPTENLRHSSFSLHLAEYRMPNRTVLKIN